MAAISCNDFECCIFQTYMKLKEEPDHLTGPASELLWPNFHVKRTIMSVL